jgi:UDP:flavonoid glycosyltransferase YjiC (YdhE family)
MRILFCSTAGAGHVGPLLPVARKLSRRGHEVLFLLPAAGRRPADDAGFAVEQAPAVDAVADRAIQDAIQEDPTRATVLINRDYFGRLCTEATLPAAEELCARWKPDLVLHEAAEYASALAAHRAGIPHAQLAIGLAGIEWASLHHHAAHELPAFQADAVGIVASSPYLTRLPEGLDPSLYVKTLRYRNHAGDEDRGRAAGSSGEAEALIAELAAPGGRFVYATLGSMAGGSQWWPGAYRVLLDAFGRLGRAERDVRVLLTVGRGLDPADLGPIPANTRVAAWAPQDRAFAVAKAVVSHGGSGTAYGALAAGLPSVFFPLFADQPHNARQIADGGAGLAIDTQDLRRHGMPIAGEPADRARLTALADEVAEALTAVLRESAYTARARELGAQLAALPQLSAALSDFVHV